MNNALLNMGVFLISALFSLYIYAVMLRFLLQWVKADFYNPICQFLMRVTNGPLVPLRRIIPGWFGLDWAAVVLMFVLSLLCTLLLSWMKLGIIPPFSFLLIASVMRLVTAILNLYFFAIIARALASWFTHNPYHAHPILEILHKLTEPLLSPARRIIPPIAGVDLSPIAVLLLIQAINVLLSNLL